MFFLYHHNNLSRLAELLAALRDRHRPAPLAEDVVLVPNRGLGRWLAIQIAEHDGVCANLRTALPGHWFWQVIERLMPTAHARARELESDRLPWQLYRALPGVAATVPEVAAYLGEPVDDIRRWQLAARLADVFDRYLVYRGDVLARWQAGERGAGCAGWQSAVWRYLINDYGLGEIHRAGVVAELAARLEAGDGELVEAVGAACPPRIYALGLVSLPPDHLQLAYALARHIDVHFLLPNPSATYWADVTAKRLPLALPDAPDGLHGERAAGEHPLLASFGRTARDTLRLLYADAFSAMVEPELGDALAYDAPGDDTLLHRIQTDIVAGAPRVTATGAAADDRSLEIHACHSALREIQVLQDQLLERLSADPTLELRDIVVMLPDVSAHVAAIQAVFAGASGRRRLAFTIADRPAAALHPIVGCFIGLLDLPLWRWPASGVLDLLQVPAVRRRFGLEAADVAQITRWIDAAGVRWGRDADHRESLGAGAFEQNTWRFGLDRLLLGLAQADDETLIDGVAPWSDLEGSAAQALGGLSRFVSTLADYADLLARPAPPTVWQTRLNALLDALFDAGGDAADELRALAALRAAFAGFENATAGFAAVASDADDTIAWTAVRDYLQSALAAPSERQPFLAGGITFCGLVPLRAVPFRLICVLGLNDDAFPRQDAGRGFNMMFDAPRLGDPGTRDDDRLLFLQALTAAGDALYLSYVGQDPASGERLPPSPVVGELQSFVHAHYFHGWSHAALTRRLVHLQPMQPFSARYFDPNEPDPRVFTYNGAWRAASLAARGARRGAEPWLDDTRAPTTAADTAIDLASLKRFFDHPPKAFFEQRLGLRLERRTTDIDDQEPIELAALDRAGLRRRLFMRAAADGARGIAETPSALELARGGLPPPPRAAPAFEREARIVNQLLPIYNAWQADAGERATVAIDLDFDDLRLTGRVADVGPTHLRRVGSGRLRTRFALRCWIEYLAVVASGYEIGLEMAGLNPISKKDDVVGRAARMTPAAARTQLARLLRCYVDGHARALAFHPDLADDYQPGQAKAFSNLWKRYARNQRFNKSHLVEDAYFSLLLGDDDAPLGDETSSPFLSALAAISQPMYDALTALVLPTDAMTKDSS